VLRARSPRAAALPGHRAHHPGRRAAALCLRRHQLAHDPVRRSIFPCLRHPPSANPSASGLCTFHMQCGLLNVPWLAAHHC
jgi:hypothetical protein